MSREYPLGIQWHTWDCVVYVSCDRLFVAAVSPNQLAVPVSAPTQSARYAFLLFHMPHITVAS